MATAAPKIPMATPAALKTAFVGAAPLPDAAADAEPDEAELAGEVVPVAVDLEVPDDLAVPVVAPTAPLLTTELAIAISSLKTLL